MGKENRYIFLVLSAALTITVVYQNCASEYSAPTYEKTEESSTVEGASCAATTISWGDCIVEIPARTSLEGMATVNNARSGFTGNAFYECLQNGQFFVRPESNCARSSTPVTQCVVSAGQTWTTNGQTCTIPTSMTFDIGATVSTSDVSNGATGTATYRCDAGGVATLVGSTCAMPVAANCPTQNFSWTVGSHTCNSSLASTAPGVNAMIVEDDFGPTTGTGIVNCGTNGAWSAVTSPVCVSRCASQTVTWSQNSISCTGTLVGLSNGANASVSSNAEATVSPGRGSATFTCNNGTISAPSNPVCASRQTVFTASCSQSGTIRYSRSTASVEISGSVTKDISSGTPVYTSINLRVRNSLADKGHICVVPNGGLIRYSQDRSIANCYTDNDGGSGRGIVKATATGVSVCGDTGEGFPLDCDSDAIRCTGTWQ